jgi:RNA polymerase sigma factor (sigma-70 family)
VRADDVDELYRLLSRQLLRIVRCLVRAPDPVIEDACQFAWIRLLHHRHRIERETAQSWLVTTAVHEALKLVRHTVREVSLDRAVEQGIELRPASSPQGLAENRERLGSLAQLSQRQQRFLWLYGVGLTYEEIARMQGCTARTVERQLHRARSSLQVREG